MLTLQRAPRRHTVVWRRAGSQPCTHSQDTFRQLRAQNIFAPRRFEGGGRRDLLVLRGASSDSVVQMALQLAQWRDQGELVATYEAATTRRFRRGRTETIRSCSAAAAKFVRTMDDRDADDAEKFTALLGALKEHGAWLVACSNGKGVDRHLMGLRIAAGLSGIPVPALFTDPSYSKTSTWRLSTSNISNPGAGPSYHDFGGFGPPNPDSYGVAYGIQEQAIQVLASSHPECKTRDAHRFSEVILCALEDVFGLVKRVVGSNSSKL